MLRLSIKDCRKYFTVIKISVWNDDVVVCFLKVLTLFRLGFLRVAQLGGEGGGEGGRKVPAAYNSKTINGNEMKLGGVVKNH